MTASLLCGTATDANTPYRITSRFVFSSSIAIGLRRRYFFRRFITMVRRHNYESWLSYRF